MKKYLPYILLFILCIVAVILLFSNKSEKQFDKKVTLNKNYTAPYGTYVAHSMLPLLFSNAKLTINKKSPSEWFYGNEELLENNLLFIVTQHFNPNEEEMLLLNRFVEQGNYIYIVAPKMDNIATEYFGINMSYNTNFFGNYRDSVTVALRKPPFLKDSSYFYPGFTFGINYTGVDTTRFQIFGTNEDGRPNFIKADAGKGSFYLHADPFMFSNYFILYNNNKDYFQKSISVLPNTIKKIMWDEYYVYKLQDNEKAKEPSPLRVLLNTPAFFWAFWTAIALLALYLLLNVKRNQRPIPIIKKPTNQSLDFVKTIGRLYFEKQDHTNLAQKMVTYFLEHVRSKYFINTSFLNDEFVQKLSGKSGYDEIEINKILQSIINIHTSTNITQKQLTNYYQQFQKFYKYTT